ncbi:MAG: hypothetical protein CMP76_07935 [Flavobacterium sp.]|uniref:hypothetical protein n=1 Tax=Flavobacterium sp. TaxID=239 RepID=UPI000C378E29|nr:hypothetical protein [Flavobacterium sp.]MBF03210.1 hypothetical protein [Flavobacterium sp.]|tara:strand:- start:337 stop:561 length:225 start_codon:yes stop_codon:yes gene_type:complete
MSKLRTLQICLSDIPKDKIIKHQNGKEYALLKTFDYDTTNDRDEDFSISMMLTAEEQQKKQQGETIKQTFVGSK